MPTMSIREAHAKDLDDLAGLFDGYRQFYECEPDLAGAAAWMTVNFTEQRSKVFVAEQTGALVGFTQLFARWICSPFTCFTTYLLIPVVVAQGLAEH